MRSKELLDGRTKLEMKQARYGKDKGKIGKVGKVGFFVKVCPL